MTKDLKKLELHLLVCVNSQAPSEHIVKINRKPKTKPGAAQTELCWTSQTVAKIIFLLGREII